MLREELPDLSNSDFNSVDYGPLALYNPKVPDTCYHFYDYSIQNMMRYQAGRLLFSTKASKKRTGPA